MSDALKTIFDPALSMVDGRDPELYRLQGVCHQRAITGWGEDEHGNVIWATGPWNTWLTSKQGQVVTLPAGSTLNLEEGYINVRIPTGSLRIPPREVCPAPTQ